MTKVFCLFTKNRKIKSIHVSGHSDFSSWGKDIVCSAISSVCDGTFSFLSSNYKEFCLLKRDEASVYFFSLKNNYDVQVCLRMLLHQLKNISHFYPKNLSILEDI